MIKKAILVFFIIAFCQWSVCAATLSTNENTGQPKTVYIQTEKGVIPLYTKSYALLIGVSQYDYGWSQLPGVRNDMALVKESLESHGFEVITVNNPDFSLLKRSFEEFINQYGMDYENRLLFYFSGHGHTETQAYGGDIGYIVPKDAPLPTEDKHRFFSKALSMEQFEVYAKNIQSKHALFVFDSCFSGSIFSVSRSVPEIVSYKSQNPVRQFITSGSKNEKVPDVSIFRSQFVAGLAGQADMNSDGYVTGSELGLFLENKVVQYSKNTQHPQYGKIRNPHLDKGDLLFQVDDLKFRLSVEGQEEYKYTKEKDSNLIWHAAAISLALSSAYVSYDQSKKYNDLRDENSTISDSINPMLSSSEYNLKKQQYDSNSSKMDEYKRNILILDVLTVSALVWEGYLIYDSFFGSAESNSDQITSQHDLNFKPSFASKLSPLNGLSLNYRYSW